jgi:hypothetical protein
MFRSVVWYGSRISAKTISFISPARAKLGTTIRALKVTSVIKINLNVARYDITFFSG